MTHGLNRVASISLAAVLLAFSSADYWPWAESLTSSSR